MLLHDRPESADIRFGHKTVSDWLAKKIQSLKPPFRLAITGGLGTGKSTILQEAIEQIRKQKNIAVSYVDIWKLDKESVRRSALLRIAKDLIKDPKEELKLRESLYGTFSEASYVRPFRKAIDTTGFWISLSLLAGVGILTYAILSSMAGTSQEPWWWKALISFGVSAASLAVRLLEKSFVHIQRTFNRAPMVGAEEFEEGLQKIVDSPKISGKQIIIVFDNIDRASPESSKAILAGISAFFDHSGHDRERNVLIIVPYDPSSLRKMQEDGRAVLDDCEKMFDAIIPLPKLTAEDLTDFAYGKLKDALADFAYNEETLSNLAWLASVSPYKSPREIKHMVNQLLSKLTLAKATESSRENRLQTDATLLLAGTVTNEPDTLFKVLICEKILPDFTEVVVSNGIELKDAFDPSAESPFMQMLSSKNEKEQLELASFLQASLGVPKEPPSSASPFLYMKGPDQILAIPAGLVVTDALSMGDGDKIKSTLGSMGDGKSPVSQKDIAAIVAHFRKNRKNPQAIKNCVRALHSGLDSIEKFEKALAHEMCETVIRVPDILMQLSPAFIFRYTKDAFELNSVQKLWKLMDESFKGSLSKESQSVPQVKKWCEEFLAALFVQNEGLKRSGIDKLPLSLVLSDAVKNGLGDSYPGKFCSPQDVIEGVKLYLSETDSEKEDRLSNIVSSAWSTVTSFEGIDSSFQEISALWQKQCENWFKEKGPSKVSEKLSMVVFFWPKGNKNAEQILNQLRDWIAQKLGQFHTKANQGFSSEALDIGLAFYKAGYVSDGNIDSILQHSLGTLNRENFETLRSYYSDLDSHVWKPLQTRAKEQLFSAVDRTKTFDLLVKDKPEGLISRFSAEYSKCNSKKEFLDALINSDVKSEDIESIFDQFKNTTGDARAPMVKLASAKCPEEKIESMLIEFATKPDSSNQEVFDAAKELPLKTRAKVCDTVVDRLMALQAAWSDKESNTFKWTDLAADQLTNLKVKEVAERALDKGVQNGTSNTCKLACTTTILDLWTGNHGFDERNFKILRRVADDQFSGRLADLAVKYNVKDTLADKVVDLVEKVTS